MKIKLDHDKHIRPIKLGFIALLEVTLIAFFVVLIMDAEYRATHSGFDEVHPLLMEGVSYINNVALLEPFAATSIKELINDFAETIASVVQIHGLVLILFFLLLLRQARTLFGFSIFAFICLLVFFLPGVILHYDTLQQAKTNYANIGLGFLLENQINIPSVFAFSTPLIPLLTSLVAVLFICPKRKPIWFPFVLFSIILLLVRMIVSLPTESMLASVDWRLAFLWYGLFAGCFFYLPGQRKALDRLFATTPRRIRKHPEFRSSIQRSVGILTCLLLGSTIIIASVLNFLNRQVYRTLNQGMYPVSVAPKGAANMREVIGSELAILDNELPGGHPNDYSSTLSQNPPLLSQESISNLFDTLDEEYIDAMRAEWEPFMEGFARGAAADLSHNSSDDGILRTGFLTYRQLSRHSIAELFYFIAQDRPEEALDAIENVLRISNLLDEDLNAFLVDLMISQVVRTVGMEGSRIYVQAYQGDSEKLDLLRERIDLFSLMVRKRFPFDRLSSEPGFWQVSTFAEYSLPGMERAHTRYYTAWVMFDFLEIALAIEAYRESEGALPETISMLVPEYLEFERHHPLTDKPYEMNSGIYGYTISSATGSNPSGSFGISDYSDTETLKMEYNYLQTLKGLQDLWKVDVDPE